jgi:hypothetical protein
MTYRARKGNESASFMSGYIIEVVLFDPPVFDPVTKTFHNIEVTLLSYPRDPSEPGRYLVNLDFPVLDKAGNIKPSPSDDVAVVKIAVSTGATPSTPPPQLQNPRYLQPLPGVTFKESASSGLIGVGLDDIKAFAQVNVGNEVIVFGYPTSIGLQYLQQLDPLRPLLRKGIVAGDNVLTHSIVLDCLVYQGNSGGPVLEIDPQAFGARLWVIGVVSQFVPYADIWLNERQRYTNTTVLNSGYSIASPMDAVLELTK